MAAWVQKLEPRVLLSASPVVTVTPPATIDEGQQATLSASGSYDPDGSPLSYEWDLDNNGTWDAFSETVVYDPSMWGAAAPDGSPRTVRLRVSDNVDPATEATTTVTVQNVAPALSAMLDQSSVYAGDTVRLTGTVTDFGVWDTQNLVVNWDDGSPEETVTLNGDYGNWTFDVSHQFTAAGSLTVKLFAWDGDMTRPAQPSWSGTVSVEALTFTITGGATADEGSDYTIQLASPVAMENWQIYWGDGFSDFVNGSTTSVPHHYWDDNPTQTSQDLHEITVHGTRNGQSVTQTASVTVRNVTPTLAASLDQSSLYAGDTVRLTGTITDIGVWDTQNLVVNWDDGSPEETITLNGSYGNWTFDVTHQYTAVGGRNVKLFAWDDDMTRPEQPTWSGTVGVEALTFTIAGGATADEGSDYTIQLTSPVTMESWEIYWGDGFSDLINGATTSVPHHYWDDNPTQTSEDLHEITVHGTRNGQSATQTAQVTVRNVTPTLSASLDQSSLYAGDTVRLTGTIADIGVWDTQNLVVDWGDGTSEETVTLNGSYGNWTFVSRTSSWPPARTR